MERNEEEFAKYLQAFAQDVWQQLMKVSQAPGQVRRGGARSRADRERLGRVRRVALRLACVQRRAALFAPARAPSVVRRCLAATLAHQSTAPACPPHHSAACPPAC